MRPTQTYVLFITLLNASCYLHAATYVPFLTKIGLTLADIAYVNAVYWIVIVLLNVPTGLFADRISRRAALALGVACHAIGNVLYALARSRSDALLGEIVIGFGAAFLDGVQQAWLVDALARRGESGRLKSTLAAATIASGLAAVPCSILGSWWAAAVGLTNIWWPSLVCDALCGLVVWRGMNQSGEPLKRLDAWLVLCQSFGALRSNRALRWLAAAAALLGCVVPFHHYWAPFFQGRGVSVGSLGYVWGPIYGAVVVGGLAVRRGWLRGSSEGWLPVSTLVTGLGLAAVGWLPGVALPLAAACLHDVGVGAFRPLLDAATQRRIDSSWRATYGSLQSLFTFAGKGLVLAVVTWFMTGRSDLRSITWTWTACGLALILGAGLLWRLAKKK